VFVFGALSGIVLTIGLFLFILFKAEMIVKFLKLDKGFDHEMIDFGAINPNDIIKIGVFVTGGLLIISCVPFFLSDVCFYVRHSFLYPEDDSQSKYNLIVSGLQIVLGYILLTNSTLTNLLKL
jgi:hypothetical protein